jgi:hypothetical protein
MKIKDTVSGQQGLAHLVSGAIQEVVGPAILRFSVGDRVSVTIPRSDRHFETIDIARSEIESADQEKNIPHLVMRP